MLLTAFVLADILGPPGSGVEWLRYIIEQLTGLKTGSTHVRHSEIFTGEGHTTKVCLFMYIADEIITMCHIRTEISDLYVEPTAY